MLRTQVRSINNVTLQAAVGTINIGQASNALHIDRFIPLTIFPGLQVRDICKCDGAPYTTAKTAFTSNYTKNLPYRSTVTAKRGSAFIGRQFVIKSGAGKEMLVEVVKVGNKGYTLRPLNNYWK